MSVKVVEVMEMVLVVEVVLVVRVKVVLVMVVVGDVYAGGGGHGVEMVVVVEGGMG